MQEDLATEQWVTLTPALPVFELSKHVVPGQVDQALGKQVREVGRYQALVDDEEADELLHILGALEKKDAVATRAEAIHKLPVSAFHCSVCNSFSERRSRECAVRLLYTPTQGDCCGLNSCKHISLPLMSDLKRSFASLALQSRW